MFSSRLSNGPPVWWSAPSSWAECRRLLPTHSWLGEGGSNLSVSRGDIWVVLADVLTRRIGRHTRGPLSFDVFKVERPTTLPNTVAAVLPVGTVMRVADISGYVDFGCGWPGVGEHLDFELPGGSVHVTLETHEAAADTRDASGPWSDVVRWGDIMAAAVIVPASHSFARDPALVAATLERIEGAGGGRAWVEP